MFWAFLAALSVRGRLEPLLSKDRADPGALAAALALAFFFGAAHALTPGHGKTIVAAYLAGSRGRVFDAFHLGFAVTVTHTASVFVLGLAALYASRQVALERVHAKLTLASGVLVLLIGLWLLFRRLGGHARGARRQDHGHPHPHPHTDSPAGLLPLGFSSGLAPCPEALVVLLLSITLGKLPLGLAVLVSFSLGLAAVLIAIGVAAVLAAPALDRLTSRVSARALPVASAAAVTVTGALLTAQALR